MKHVHTGLTLKQCYTVSSKYIFIIDLIIQELSRSKCRYLGIDALVMLVKDDYHDQNHHKAERGNSYSCSKTN